MLRPCSSEHNPYNGTFVRPYVLDAGTAGYTATITVTSGAFDVFLILPRLQR
ncbi:MAG: hypothetical protein IH876_10615 [Gemmatimonadetes bacterium]|nr:hypothetical protein [Gemmatimonadota bacterium]